MSARSGLSLLACTLGLLLLSVQVSAQPDYRVEINPPEWKFGMIDQGAVAKTRVEARNTGLKAIDVSLVSTCDCLVVSPLSRHLAPGASGSFDIAFDSRDYAGITTRGLLISTDAPGAKPLFYRIYGVVRVERPSPPAGSEGLKAGGKTWETAPGLLLSYYYTQGCKSCEEFLSVEIPKLESSLGLSIKVEKKDILDPGNFEELSLALKAAGARMEALPAIRLGGRIVQGDARIRDELPGLLLVSKSAPAAAAAASLPASGGAGTAALDTDRFAIFPVIAAGLIDGVNPCAFTTLIFLLASLALAGRGRREVLVIGALFSLGVFLTYLAVGFGLFAALRAASGVALVATVLKWLLFAALAVFTALSIYDYFLIRAGKASEMVLQLPKAIKGRIHASIRTRARSATLALSSLVLGFLVSIFEFACTGQVYLPTLAYLARVQRRSDALGLLLLYNLCFIAPLLVVFGATYFGVSSKRITGLFQRQMGKVKLGLALAFLVLAVLTVAF